MQGPNTSQDTPGERSIDVDAAEARTSSSLATLATYRAAVAGLTAETLGCIGPEHADRAVAIVTEGLADPTIAPVLDRLPHGADGARAIILDEIRRYRPSARSAASDLNALIRIWLLSQVDAVWWAHTPMFETDRSVLSSPELVRLDSLRRRGKLHFRFTGQPKGLPGRVRNGVRRRLWPGLAPHTAGLRFVSARPEAVALINQLAVEFAAAARPGTPPLWVTSTVRSVEHQRHLSDLGYSALLPSAHCAGYATDLELRWFERFGESHTLAAVLLEHQSRGEINVIDEGQAWHVCINPATVDDLRARYRNLVSR